MRPRFTGYKTAAHATSFIDSIRPRDHGVPRKKGGHGRPGVKEVSRADYFSLRIDTPGRCRLEWRTRIGQDTGTTDHNDSWGRFPDAVDSYGLRGKKDAEFLPSSCFPWASKAPKTSDDEKHSVFAVRSKWVV